MGVATIVSGSSGNRASIVGRRSRQHSRITNGTALLPNIDGRSAWVRRAKDLIATHSADCPDASAAEQSIIRRISVLTVELERREAKFSSSGEATATDLDLYIRGCGALRRLLETLSLGLQRRSKDVTPTVDEYLAHINANGGTTP